MKNEGLRLPFPVPRVIVSLLPRLISVLVTHHDSCDSLLAVSSSGVPRPFCKRPRNVEPGSLP